MKYFFFCVIIQLWTKETTEEHPCIFTSKNDKIEVEK